MYRVCAVLLALLLCSAAGQSRAQSAEDWIERLGSEGHVRARLELVAGRKRFMAPLRRAFPTLSRHGQWNAIVAVGQVGPPAGPEWAPLLLKHAMDTQAFDTRFYPVAFDALAAIGSSTATLVRDPLLVVAGDRKLPAHWRSAALRALARIAPDHAQVSTGLQALLEEKDEDARRGALVGLAWIGPDRKLLPQIERAAADPATHIRRAALRAAARLYSKAPRRVIAILERLLDDKAITVRDATVRRLALMGWRAAPLIPKLERQGETFALSRVAAAGVPALLRMASGEHRTRRLQALRALGSLGTRAQRAVPQLVKSAEAKNWWERKVATVSLGNLGQHARPAIPLLLRIAKGTALVDPPPDGSVVGSPTDFVLGVQLDALRSLASLGSAARHALADVRELTRSDDARGPWALFAVAQIGAEPVLLTRLRGFLASDKRSVRLAAAEVAARLGGAARGCAPLLARLVETSDPLERIWFACALVRSESPEARERGALGILRGYLGFGPVRASAAAKQLTPQREALRALAILGERAAPALTEVVRAHLLGNDGALAVFEALGERSRSVGELLVHTALTSTPERALRARALLKTLRIPLPILEP